MSDLRQLTQEVLSCRTCPIGVVNGSTPVPGVGKKTGIVFVGRNPGRDEDEKSRRPFSGPSGKILDKIFLPICGLTRADVFLTNSVLCYTLNDKEPPYEDALLCAQRHLIPYLDYLEPYLVVAFGGLTCRIITGERAIAKCHGRLFKNKRGFYVIPCFHPGAMLYDPHRKIDVEYDAAQVRRFLSATDYYIQELKDWLAEDGEFPESRKL